MVKAVKGENMSGDHMFKSILISFKSVIAFIFFLITEKVDTEAEAPVYRRRRRLNKCFKGKNEESTVGTEDSQDLDFGL